MLHNKTCPVNLSVKSFNSDAAKCEKCFHLQHLHTTPGTAERKRDRTVKTKQISQSTNRDGRRRTSNHNDSVRSCKRSVSWTEILSVCLSLSGFLATNWVCNTPLCKWENGGRHRSAVVARHYHSLLGGRSGEPWPYSEDGSSPVRRFSTRCLYTGNGNANQRCTVWLGTTKSANGKTLIVLFSPWIRGKT